MATLSTSSTGTGRPINSKISSLHKKSIESSTAFWRYSHTVMLTRIPVPLLLVWPTIRNFSPSSGTQIIELRTSSLNTGRMPQPYSTTLGSQTHNIETHCSNKTHIFSYYIVLIFLFLSSFSSLCQIYIFHVSFPFFKKLKIRISSFLLLPGRDLQKKVLNLPNKI